MTAIVVYHHIQGRTAGVEAFADALRADGHDVRVPDLFDGRVFGSIDEGFAYAREVGFESLRVAGLDAAEGLPAGTVAAGFSFGVMRAQEVVQRVPGVAGGLFYHSFVDPAEFGGWPDGVPAQIHAMRDDEFYQEDAAWAEAFVNDHDDAELFVYDGSAHLFTDSSLSAYDEAAAGAVMERSREFLRRLSR